MQTRFMTVKVTEFKIVRDCWEEGKNEMGSKTLLS